MITLTLANVMMIPLVLFLTWLWFEDAHDIIESYSWRKKCFALIALSLAAGSVLLITNASTLAHCRKRAAKLKDEALFGQEHESLFGECPICMLPLPSDRSQFRTKICCMKWICSGCILAATERGMNNICAFCRQPTPRSNAAILVLIQKGVDAGNANAMFFLGEYYFDGQYGLQRDEARAMGLLREAANLGSVKAHYQLGLVYAHGERGLRTNMVNAEYHWEIAAKAGHPSARFNLGVVEARKRNYDRALKHFIIAAKMGEASSLKGIQALYKDGRATKDDYFRALVEYQQAVQEAKSNQREKFKALIRA